jgi:hypothetical protein
MVPPVFWLVDYRSHRTNRRCRLVRTRRTAGASPRNQDAAAWNQRSPRTTGVPPLPHPSPSADTPTSVSVSTSPPAHQPAQLTACAPTGSWAPVKHSAVKAGWIQCIDSQGNGGNVSGSRSAGVSVYTPAPSAITGLASSHMIACSPSKPGSFRANWNDSAYASSYGYTYSFTNGRGSRVSSSGTVSQSEITARAAYGDWSPSGNQTITVWAIGPGGKSASSSSTSYQVTHC